VSDDSPFHAVVWALRREHRVMRCELRGFSRPDAGWEVQVFEGDSMSFAQRCQSEAAARFVAASLRRDKLRDGWTEIA
jgi:hypothetical protein